MANKSPEAIFGHVFDRVLDTVSRPSVPVTSGAEREVAKAVANEIAPVIVNATNSEPWYQSRILRGLIVAGAGYLGTKIGLVIGEGDVTVIINAVAAIVEAAGIIYAAYGRIVGASKKPLGQ
jgi:hypothetical protein